MANDYQKINTLFLRDENNIIIPGQFTCPEFEYLKDCLWECTEKIDGTNIHIDYTIKFNRQNSSDEPIEIITQNICGRTEKAVIPTHLQKKLESIFPINPYDNNVAYVNHICKFHEAFSQAIEKAERDREEEIRISLYGEGYGVKIQKGGNYIKNDCGFILFDVNVNGWWLNRNSCEQIAESLQIPIVPLIGYMTIQDAIEFVKKGFKSTIAENPDYDAEGLVLKTPVGLRFRSGQRIITKIKTCDFKKYRLKYGDGPVEQKLNPQYNKKEQ